MLARIAGGAALLVFAVSSCGSSTPAAPTVGENLTFTGQLIGSMTTGTAGAKCGKSGAGYTAEWSGPINDSKGKATNGSPWSMEFDIISYHGPSTYTIVQNITGHASMTTTAGVKTYLLIFATQVVINKDEHSGSFKGVEFSQNGKSPLAAAVVAQGTWHCA